MNDPRRFFTAAQARQKAFACNGKCERCGGELENGFHLHHIKPHSKGGQTVLANWRSEEAEKVEVILSPLKPVVAPQPIT